jgi:hypothetical protein
MISWWKKQYRHGHTIQLIEQISETKELDQLLYVDNTENMFNGILYLVRWDSESVKHVETPLLHEFFHGTRLLYSVPKKQK